MTDQPNKTPGQVAMTKRELFDLLMKCGGERRATSDDWLEPFAAAVLAHAAPKWHPVSEPVPSEGGLYWIRFKEGFVSSGPIRGWDFERNKDIAHWSGPVEPPTF